jgi:hypothetical protein
VLGIARRDHDHPADRLLPGAPDGVGHPPRHEDEAACGDRELAIPRLERGLSRGELERLVGVGVDVQGRAGIAGRKRADQNHV